MDRPSWLQLRTALQTFFLGLMVSSDVLGGGATLITHGYLHKVEDWVVPMGLAAARHPRRLHEFGPDGATVYVLKFNPDRTLRATYLRGPAPLGNRSGDVILLLDWNPYSGDLNPFSPAAENTPVIGPIVAEQLLLPNLLPGFPGSVTRLPLHLVGFSRGGSLVCEIAKRLGEHQVVVDHLTLIDPHASNNDGFKDPLPMVDGTVVAGVYENVLFADCVYQTVLFPTGSSARGAYVRSLTGWGLDGWGQYLLPHDNAHLWYHGTVEVTFPVTSDGNASLTASTRSKWYAPVEDQGRRAGYHYSLRAGGDRREVFEPVDSRSGFPRLGLNQVWGEALGIPSGTNRTLIPDLLPEDRPNLIEFHLAGFPIHEEVPTPFPYGAPIRCAVEDPSAGSLTGRLVYLLRGNRDATLTVFADADENSFNGWELGVQFGLLPTGDLPAVVDLDLRQLQNGIARGLHHVGVLMESGTITREYYALERLQKLQGGTELVSKRTLDTRTALREGGKRGALLQPNPGSLGYRKEPLNGPSPLLRYVTVPSGTSGGTPSPRLEIQAASPAIHVVESSADLVVWTPVWQGALEVSASGAGRVLEGLDLGSGDAKSPRFFRVRVQ